MLSQAVEIAFPIPVREVVMMGRYPHFTGRPSASDEEICDEVMRVLDVADARRAQLRDAQRRREAARQLRACSGAGLAAARRDRPISLSGRAADLPRHPAPARFMNIVRRLADREDVTVVGVVHDLNLAARFADRLLLLDAGRVVASGAPTEVLTPAVVQQVFRVQPVIVTNPLNGCIHLIFE